MVDVNCGPFIPTPPASETKCRRIGCAGFISSEGGNRYLCPLCGDDIVLMQAPLPLKRQHYRGPHGSCPWCGPTSEFLPADDCPPSGAEMRKLFNELRELVADLRRVHELQEKE